MFSQIVRKWMSLTGILALIAAPTVTAQEATCEKEREAFQRVVKNLDLNGNFLIYSDTKDAVKVMDTMVDGARKYIAPLLIQGKPDNAVMMIQSAEKLLQSLYTTSGVRELNGFGLSSVKIGEELYRTKGFVSRTPGSNGRIWKLMGGAPQNIDYIRFLPKTTAGAAFGDFDLNELWSWQFELVQATGNPMIVGLHQGQIMALQQQNINLGELIRSTGGNYGMVLTLDETSQMTFPLGKGKVVKFPEPGLAFFVKVKDTKLRDFLFSQLVIKNDGQETPLPFTEKQVAGITLRSYTLPLPLPLPFQVLPTVAVVDGYMIIASSPKLMEEMINSKKKGTGLKNTDLFKKLMVGMPTKGNSFNFVSPVLATTAQGIQKQISASQGKTGAATRKSLEAFGDLFQQKNAFTLNISSVGVDGITMIGKTNMGASKSIATQVGALAALGAGIALPEMVKGGGKASRAMDVANLKQLGLGMLMYSGDHNGEFPNDMGKLVEDNYIQAGKVFVTPGTPADRVPANAADLRAGKCGYDYYGKGLKDDNPQASTTVLACTKPGKLGEWINVLFVDGHVDSVRATSLQDAARKRGWTIKK